MRRRIAHIGVQYPTMNEQLTVDQCYASLRNVIDPELYQNIVDLGLVYGVEVKDANQVFVTMTLTTPHCPMGPQILADVDKFLRADGAEATWTCRSSGNRCGRRP